jgi:hypothetical protein
VKRLFGAWIFFTSLASVALLFARLLAADWFTLELDIYILVVGGIALLDVVVLAREAYPRENVPAIVGALEREPAERQRPVELERLERALTMATATAFDLHAHLLPQLREIAAMRLGVRGLRLDESEEALGEELWELVRPEREAPTDRHASGIAPDALRRAVEGLESL